MNKRQRKKLCRGKTIDLNKMPTRYKCPKCRWWMALRSYSNIQICFNCNKDYKLLLHDMVILKNKYLELHKALLEARSSGCTEDYENYVLEILDKYWKVMTPQHKEEVNKIIKRQVQNETIS